jgi:cobalt-zinc-cadmium efflux system membrane fusion protein
VTAGRTDEKQAEIISGLTAGQQYVTNGAFALKAQLSKSAFGDEHGH